MISEISCPKCGQNKIQRKEHYNLPVQMENEKGRGDYYLCWCSSCGKEFVEFWQFSPAGEIIK